MRSHFQQLTKVPWEWRVELTFTDMALSQLRGGKLADPSKLVYRYFIRNVAVGEGLVVGAAHVFIEAGHDARPHAHVLLVGRNKAGKTLADVSQARLAAYWVFGRAHVQRVDNNIAAVGYLSANCRQGKDNFSLSGHDLLNEWLNDEAESKASAAPPWWAWKHPGAKLETNSTGEREMRLTRTEWNQLRAAHEAGTSATELARKYGVTRSAIFKRSKREGWLPCGALREQAIKEAQAEVLATVAGDYKEQALVANERHLKLVRAMQGLGARVMRKIEHNLGEPNEKKRQRISAEVSALAAVATTIKTAIDGERSIMRMERLDLYGEGEKKDGFDRLCDVLAGWRAERAKLKEPADDDE